MLEKLGTTLVALGIGITFGITACDDTTGSRDSGNAPATQPTKRDTNPNKPNLQKPVYQAHISAFVDDEFAPYTVTIHARDTDNPNNVEDIGPISVPSGEWKTTVDYNEGKRVEIEVEVKPSRPGSMAGYCRIVDGRKRSEHYISGGWRAYCILTTVR